MPLYLFRDRFSLAIQMASATPCRPEPVLLFAFDYDSFWNKAVTIAINLFTPTTRPSGLIRTPRSPATAGLPVHHNRPLQRVLRPRAFVVVFTGYHVLLL